MRATLEASIIEIEDISIVSWIHPSSQNCLPKSQARTTVPIERYRLRAEILSESLHVGGVIVDSISECVANVSATENCAAGIWPILSATSASIFQDVDRLIFDKLRRAFPGRYISYAHLTS